MSKRITDDELTQEELAEIRERVDKYEEQDKPLYRTRFRKEDIDFVDNAREDIPKLLAEIDRLMVENTLYEGAVEEDDATKERLASEIDRLKEEVIINRYWRDAYRELYEGEIAND